MIKKPNRLLPQIVALLALACARPGFSNPADFTMTSVPEGKTFRLSDARGKYVALHFLLKTECPYCIKHTHDYAAKSAMLPNVEQIFLKPDSEADIKTWQAHLIAKGPTVPTIYRDPDAALADQFAIPNGYQFHGQTVHYPALILLDPQGREVFRYIGTSNVDRFPIEKLVEKIASISQPPMRDSLATASMLAK